MSTPYTKDVPVTQHTEHTTDPEAQLKASVSRSTTTDIKKGDAALALVGEDRIILTQEDNDNIRRKTDKRILSILIWIYFLQVSYPHTHTHDSCILFSLC